MNTIADIEKRAHAHLERSTTEANVDATQHATSLLKNALEDVAGQR